MNWGELLTRLLAAFFYLLRSLPHVVVRLPTVPLVLVRIVATLAQDAVSVFLRIEETARYLLHNLQALVLLTLLEVRFIARQGVTSYLILAYPVVVMLILGPSLSLMEFEKVSLAVLENDTRLAQLINESDRAVPLLMPDNASLASAVLKGKAPAGVLTTVSGYRRYVEIIGDPVQFRIASELTTIMENQLSNELARTVGLRILDIYNRTNASFSDIEERRQKLEEARQSILQYRARLDDVAAKRAGFNESALRSMLDSLRAQSSASLANITTLEPRITALNYTLKLFDAMMGEAELGAARLRHLAVRMAALKERGQRTNEQITIMLDRLERADQSLQLSIQFIDSYISQSPDDPNIGRLLEVRAQLVAMRAEIAMLRSELLAVRNAIEILSAEPPVEDQLYEAADTLESFRNKGASIARETNGTLSEFSAVSSALKGGLTSSSNVLDGAVGYLDNATRLLNSTDALLSGFASDIAMLEGELARSDAVLNAATATMRDFLSENPIDLIPPVVAMRYVIELRQIDILFPIIVVLDALLSCLLLPLMMGVRLRAQGAEMRLRLTGTSQFVLVLGRFFGDLVVGSLVVLFFLVLGVAFIDIKLPPDPVPLLYALFLAPAVFTSMGIMLSAFIRRESTAILAMLLVTIPMLFLSGVILPLEFVRQPMKTLGAYSPLYFAHQAISASLIRGLSLAELRLFTDPILAYIGLFLIAAYIIQRHEGSRM
ncbi:MAG: ABC transporter permease [Candidatus Micrarchaeia archaeon]